MRILQIGDGWQPENSGGLNRVYYDCFRYLPLIDVQVRGLVVGSASIAQDTEGQIQAFASTSDTLWRRLQKLRQVAKSRLDEECSLVVSHFALYAFPVLNQLDGRPLVVHFHGPWALESRTEGRGTVQTKCKWLLERRVYHHATCLIVLSQAFGKILHEVYGIPYERIHVIPGGIAPHDICQSPAEARTQLVWPCDRRIILAVRRLQSRMGLENLLAAVGRVRSCYPDILLLIVGIGTLRAKLENQIRQLQLEQHVRLLGFVPEEQLGQVYRAADFCVVPSTDFEGFGLVIIESLAAGTPVLGTPVGGMPEVLGPLSNELLFEGSTVEQLVQGLLEVLSGQRRLPSSEICAAYARRNYAWEVVAGQIKAVYQRALKAG